MNAPFLFWSLLGGCLGIIIAQHRYIKELEKVADLAVNQVEKLTEELIEMLRKEEK